MAEDRTMEGIHNDLIKRYHTLCGRLGLTEAEREAALEAYGVASSKDMDTHDLLDLIAKLQKQLNREQHTGECDKLRKQVFASIGKYLRRTGRESNASIIKAIACRATKHSDFNKIPRERLRNLVNAFNNKTKDMDAVEELTKSKVIQLIPRQ